MLTINENAKSEYRIYRKIATPVTNITINIDITEDADKSNVIPEKINEIIKQNIDDEKQNIDNANFKRIPCAFDNLPPGAYCMTCNCPRCSLWC